MDNKNIFEIRYPDLAEKLRHPDENTLAARSPELAAQWHPTLNGGLTPEMFTPGSEKKVWWICSKGHEWQATIDNRMRGRKCPFCSNRKVLKGQNDLATTHPELAAQWHPTKNGELTPEVVVAGTYKKVWWICDKGHEWQATVANRSRGTSCPYCAGQKVIPGKTDLATVNPELAAEWHPTKNGELTPQNITPGVHQAVWWLGKCGHEWQATVSNRIKGRACPFCSNRKVLKGQNDLATTHPELAAQWHPTKNGELTPEVVVAGTYKKVWWRCYKGHEWQASIYTRSHGTGCPVCLGEKKTSFAEQAILYYLKKVTVAENRNTEFGKEIDVWLPELQVGIEYNGEYFHRNRKHKDKEKLAYFTEKKIRIVSVNEGIQNRIIGDFIEYIYSATNRDSLNWVITSLLHLLGLPKLAVDTDSDTSLIYSQYIETEKKKSLAENFPELAAEWHPTKNGDLTPEMVTPKSNKKMWWLGKCGHEWQAIVSSRSSGNGCPYCAGQKVIPGKTDLATKNPELAAQWHPTLNGGLTPLDVTLRSGQKVWWLCNKCGHEWEAIIKNRSSGACCPVCARKKSGKTRRKNNAKEQGNEGT